MYLAILLMITAYVGNVYIYATPQTGNPEKWIEGSSRNIKWWV